MLTMFCNGKENPVITLILVVLFSVDVLFVAIILTHCTVAGACKDED